MPNYCFNLEDLNTHRVYNPNSYRNVVSSCINEMNTMLEKIADSINSESITSAIDLLTELQQAAIDLGTYTEMVKGEGYDIVRDIEQFCEDIFILSERLNSIDTSCNENELDIDAAYSSMDQRFAIIVEAYNLREEVVFICLRPEYFKGYYKFYEEAVADPNKDVYIIPIPWYKRNVVGMREKVYLFEDGYPEGSTVFNYQKYLVSVHEPETVYIQYSQDQYDDGTDIFEEYYSLNLRKYTDRLVLVPYKEYPVFSEMDTSFYYSMKYYVTMPGVMCADEVLLCDDWLRELYIKKLIEFTGEDFRGIWENKICVIEKTSNTNLLLSISDIKKEWNGYCENLGNEWYTSGGKIKKIILYQPVFSSFYEYGIDIIGKIEKNLEIFKDASDDIVVIWLEQLPIKRDLNKLDKMVVKKYRGVVEKFVSEDYGIFVSDSIFDGKYNLSDFLQRLEDAGIRKEATLERIVIEISDAYYGDGDYVARQFVLEKKPVMIQNIAV